MMMIFAIISYLLQFQYLGCMANVEFYKNCTHKDTNVLVRWTNSKTSNFVDKYDFIGHLGDEKIFEKKKSTLTYYVNPCVSDINQYFLGIFVISLENPGCKSKTFKMSFTDHFKNTKDLSFQIDKLQDCTLLDESSKKVSDLSYDHIVQPEIEVSDIPKFKKIGEEYEFSVTSKSAPNLVVTSVHSEVTVDPLSPIIDTTHEVKVSESKVTIKTNHYNVNKHVILYLTYNEQIYLVKESEDDATGQAKPKHIKEKLIIHQFKKVKLASVNEIDITISHLEDIKKYNLPLVKLKLHVPDHVSITEIKIGDSSAEGTSVTIEQNFFFKINPSIYCGQYMKFNFKLSYGSAEVNAEQTHQLTCGLSINQYYKDNIENSAAVIEGQKYKIPLKVKKNSLITHIVPYIQYTLSSGKGTEVDIDDKMTDRYRKDATTQQEDIEITGHRSEYVSTVDIHAKIDPSDFSSAIVGIDIPKIQNKDGSEEEEEE